MKLYACKTQVSSRMKESSGFAMNFEEEQFLKLASFKMPFGRFKGVRLIDIPEEYYIWYRQKGLPEGELGRMMAAAYEIKVNGLEYLFDRYR